MPSTDAAREHSPATGVRAALPRPSCEHRGASRIAAIVAGGTALVFDQTQTRPERLPNELSSVLLDRHLRTGVRQLPPRAAAEWSIARKLLARSASTQTATGPCSSDRTGERRHPSLAHVAHAEAGDLGAQSSDFHVHPGSAPVTLRCPRFLVARTSGTGEQTLTWKVRSGNWRVIS